MIPSGIVLLDDVPRLGSGKVDRAALPAPGDVGVERTEEFVAPRDAVEGALVEVWAGILGVERIGVHDNFFELGGDSILSIQVVSRAAEAGLGISVSDVFEHQTVAQLARDRDGGDAGADQGMVTGDVTATPVQRWFLDQDHVDAHHFNHAVTVPLPAGLSRDTLELALLALLAHHDQLRARFRRAGGDWRQWIETPDTDVPLDWVQTEESRGPLPKRRRASIWNTVRCFVQSQPANRIARGG